MVVNTSYRPGLQDTSSWGQAFSRGIQVKEEERKRLEAEAAAQKAKDEASAFNPYNRLIATAAAFVASGGNPIAAGMAGVTAKDGPLDVTGSAIGGGSQGLMAGMMTPSTPAATPGLQPIGINSVLAPVAPGANNLMPMPAPAINAGIPSPTLSPTMPGAAAQPGMLEGMINKGGQTLQAMTDSNNLSKTATMLQALQNPGKGPELLAAMDTLKKAEDAKALATADKAKEFGLKEREVKAKEDQVVNEKLIKDETNKIKKDAVGTKAETTQAEKAAGKQLAAIQARVGKANDTATLDQILKDAQNDPSLKNSKNDMNDAIKYINSRREQIKPPKETTFEKTQVKRQASEDQFNSLSNDFDNLPTLDQSSDPVSINKAIAKFKSSLSIIRNDSTLIQTHKDSLTSKINAKIKELNKILNG